MTTPNDVTGAATYAGQLEGGEFDKSVRLLIKRLAFNFGDCVISVHVRGPLK